MPPITPVNAGFKNDDLAIWNEYKRNPTPLNRQALLRRFDGLIQNQVNKWSGPVSRDVLLNEAKLLAAKAFDNYNPASGAALATYLTSQLLPLSRIVYTYQNAARMPENITQKINTFQNANNTLTITLGREPTTDELHTELGWTAPEITRIRDYNRRDLVESGPAVSGDFFGRNNNDEDDMLLGAIYFELSPDEKRLFEATTGYNGARIMKNGELTQLFGITQAQLSYRKEQLRKRIAGLLERQKRIG